MASNGELNEYSLTETEEMFAQYYVYGEKPFNNRYTYMQVFPDSKLESAGVSANRLLKNNKLLKRIDDLKKEKIDRLRIDSDYLTLQMLDIAEKCSEAKPVIALDRKTGKFKETGTYEFDSKGAISSMQTVAKLQGYLLDNKTINANITQPVTIVNDLKPKKDKSDKE